VVLKGEKNMKKEDILKALKEGNYEIKRESDCRCYIKWNIRNGKLECTESGDECWVAKILYIDGKPIIQHVVYEPIEILINDLTIKEFNDMIYDNNLDYIIDKMDFETYEEENDAHEAKVKEFLIDYINDHNYSCYIRYPRNFSNEYNCVLAEQEAKVKDAEEVTPEIFVEKYLQKDDIMTQYFIGFEFIK